MKKIKLLAPTLGIVAAAGAIAPIASCSKATTITNISVKTKPTKLTYEKGEPLQLAGLIVLAKYSDNTTKELPSSEYTTSITEGTPVSTDKTTITITAKSNSSATTSFDIKVLDVDTIEVTTKPKQEYALGQKLTLKDMVVTATMNDKSTRELSSDAYTTEPAEGTVLSTKGTQTITVKYKDNETKTDTFTVEVGDPIVETITATKDPTAKYFKGYAIDHKSPNVIGKYTDGSEMSIPSTDYSLSPANGHVFDTVGSQTITVKYLKDENVPTTTFDIEVVEAQVISIEVTKNPDITEYWAGEKLNLTGLEVTATLENGQTRILSPTEFTTDPDTETSLIEGTTSVTVTYPGVTPASFNITVNPAKITGVEVSKKPTKTTYAKGELLDLAGMEVKAIWTDREELTDKYTTEPATGTALTTIGTQTITVKLNETSFQDSFTVTVGDAKVKSIAVTNQPTKTSYNHGDALDLNGMVITATFTDGSTSTLTSDKYTTDPVDGSTLLNETTQTITDKQVTVSYKDDPAIASVKTQNISITPKPTDFTLNVSSKEIIKGNDFQLQVSSISPTTACKDVTWSSSNTSVATVDIDTGLVTASTTNTGTATITATSKINKTLSKTCEITVSDDISDITINGDHNVDIKNILSTSESKHTFTVQDQLGRAIAHDNCTWKVYDGEQTSTESSTFEVEETGTTTSIGTLQLKNGKTVPTSSTTLTIQATALDKKSSPHSTTYVVEVADFSYFKTTGGYGMESGYINSIDTLEIDHKDVVAPKQYYKDSTTGFVTQTCFYRLFAGDGKQVNVNTLYLPKTISNLYNDSTDHFGTKSVVVNNIKVDPANTTYTSQDGSHYELNGVFSKDLTTLHIGCSSTTLVPTVTKIGGYAFAHTTFTTPAIDLSSSGVTNIDTHAFSDSNITGITFNSTITTIGYQAFLNCTAINTTINIPESVTKIGAGAFLGSSVSSITFTNADTHPSQWQSTKYNKTFCYVWDVDKTDGTKNATFLNSQGSDEHYLDCDLNKLVQTDKTHETFAFDNLADGGVTIYTAYQTTAFGDTLTIPTQYVNGNTKKDVHQIKDNAFCQTSSINFVNLDLNCVTKIKRIDNKAFANLNKLAVIDCSEWNAPWLYTTTTFTAFSGCCNTGGYGVLKIKQGQDKSAWKTLFTYLSLPIKDTPTINYYTIEYAE